MRLELFPVLRFYQDGYYRAPTAGGWHHIWPRWRPETVPALIISLGPLTRPMCWGIEIVAFPRNQPDISEEEYEVYWQWVVVNLLDLRRHPWLWWSPVVPIFLNSSGGRSIAWTGREREIIAFEFRWKGWRRIIHLESPI